MKRIAALTASAALAAAPAAAAHELTVSQALVYKHRWQLSTYKLHWYHGQGRWTLRPRFDRCAQIRWVKPRGRCYKHRAAFRWHQARVMRIGRLLWPPAPAPTPAVDGCLSELIDRESGWDVHATNQVTGAYGLPQALPGSKMASAGPDWRDNAATQIRWMLGYVQKYGGSCGALSFQTGHGWY